MKIKLLIASLDRGYTEHLSKIISEKYADKFDVTVCSSDERLRDLLKDNNYEAALLEPLFSFAADTSSIRLPLVLADESTDAYNLDASIRKIKKYQRISSIVGNILENFSEVGVNIGSFSMNPARITAVWSPSGGSGKTTVALAYAAQKVSNGFKTVYFNLENFTSTPVYFQENGKSISKAFEKLESNLQIFLVGIRQQDSGSGISYFCGPENYIDINILTVGHIEKLLKACAAETEELIIDLSSQCDEKTQKILEIADKVLLIVDSSITSQKKIHQFVQQHNVFGKIQDKITLVKNKGSKGSVENITRMIQLPLVQSSDSVSIYKTLSSGSFEW